VKTIEAGEVDVAAMNRRDATMKFVAIPSGLVDLSNERVASTSCEISSVPEEDTPADSMNACDGVHFLGGEGSAK
jgi:hypothetical protein